MNVCYVSNLYAPDAVGGAELHVQSVAEQLVRDGHTVSVITTQPASDGSYRRFETDTIAGVDVHRIAPLNLYSPIEYRDVPGWQVGAYLLVDLWNPYMYRLLRRKLSGLNPDLVHVHLFRGFSNAAFAAAASGGRVIHTLHNHALVHPRSDLAKDGRIVEPGPLSWPYRRVNRMTTEPHIDRVLAPSQYIIDRHRSKGLFRNTRCTRLPLGISRPPEDRPTRPSLDGTFRVLFVGRLDAMKGTDLLIDAFGRLAEEDLRLDVLGTGPERETVEQASDRDPRIRVHGFVSNEATLREFYAKAHVTVVPSRSYDNSPMVIYESYAHGTPVIGAAIGGIPELVDEGDAGFLFEPGDAASLATALQRARDELDHDAFDRAQRRGERLTLDTHTDKLLDIYHEYTSE